MGIRRFLRRAERDRDLLEEIESYVQIGTDENIARGMPPDRARAAARLKFGSSTSVREEIYGMNTITFLETLSRDVRYGVRVLRHNPLFSTVVLLTLAISIGANTAVFSVVNSVLLRPLPYANAEQLVAVSHSAPGAPGITSVSGDLRLSPSMYFTYAEKNRTFQTLGGWFPFASTVTGLAEPERIDSILVTDGALQTLGVKPILGRWLLQSDQTPGGPERVMLSYGYWQRRFGGDRSVIGRTLRVDGRPAEIAGVMPQSFRFIDTEFEIIAPFAFNRAELRLPGFFMRSVGRLKPGVTVANATADIARLFPVWRDSWPAAPGVNPHTYDGWRIAPTIRPLKQDVVGSVGNVLWVLMGTIGIVMLITSANVANLLLVRADARRQELAVRTALGAGWTRIVRELMIESVLLALMGGALGLGLAYAGLRLLVLIGPGNLPRLQDISLDGRALGFTLAVSLLSGLLFGLLPALRYAGRRIAPALRGGGRTLSQNRERHRARNILVVTQVALALVLMVSAVLMVRTFQAIRRVDPGFTRPEQVETFRTFIPETLAADPARVVRIENDIVEKLAAIPGVKSVAFAAQVPMDGLAPNWDGIFTENQTYYSAAATPPMRVFNPVSPGVFQTLGTKLVAGRDYTWTGLYGRRPEVIVSENLARELWGSAQAAIGKRIRTGPPGSLLHEVIGVVEDVHQNGVQEPAPAIVYWPTYGEVYGRGLVNAQRIVTFIVRSDRAGTESLLNQATQAVRSVNGSLPLANVRTMRDVYSRSMARTSFTLVMLGIAGAVAMILGIVGIYGVIAYAVSQRSREIGIRSALGAQPGELKAMFVRYALTLAGIGAAIGLGAATGVMRLMKSLLFGTSPLDPLTYAIAPLVLLAAAAIASYLLGAEGGGGGSDRDAAGGIAASAISWL